MLELKGIKKIFNQGTVNETLALDSIDLRLKQGDFVCVIGGNGSGKSSLLNSIAGVFNPDEGKIILDGEDITKQNEVKRAKVLGRVFQDPMLGTASKMAIEENLALAKRRGQKRGLAWGISKAERAEYQEMVARLNLNLEGRLTDKMKVLSGGQRQALTLLMAILKRPKLLLLDEHTAALDPKTAKMVLELSKSLVKEEAITCMMVTHNMYDALKYGNRLIMMQRGRIVLDVEGEEKEKLSAKDLVMYFAD